MNCQNSIFFVVLLTISFSARIQCDSNEDQLKQGIEQLEKKTGIQIPAQFSNLTALTEHFENLKKQFKDKCAQVSGGDEAYANIEKGVQELQECTSGLIEVEVLQNEIKEAQPKGELDTVFNKYCAKREIAINCTKNFTSILEPCLKPAEIEGKQSFVKIFTNILNFVCFKEGDQIALFIAEKGPECFQEQQNKLVECLNTTFWPHVNSTNFNATELTKKEMPELVMGEKECVEMDKLQMCVVDSLETCTESTPANLAEAMFKFVRHESPCDKFNSTIAKQTSSAHITTSSSSILVASIFAFFVIRLIP